MSSPNQALPHGYRGPEVVIPAKEQPQSMAEILAEQEPHELLHPEQFMPVEVEPVSELDTQILKLKAAKDNNVQEGREIAQVLAGLLESKRSQLQERIGTLQRELAELEPQVSTQPQNGFQWPKRASKRGSGGGWNRGMTMRSKPGLDGGHTGRAINLLRSNPAKEFTTREIEQLAKVAVGNVNGCLAGTVARGEVRKRKAFEDGGSPKGRIKWSWIGAKQ